MYINAHTHQHALCTRFDLLFFRSGKYLGRNALIYTMVQFVVPNLTGGPRFVLDAILAGLVVGQWFGTGRNARLADFEHFVDRFVFFVGLLSH